MIRKGCRLLAWIVASGALGDATLLAGQPVGSETVSLNGTWQLTVVSTPEDVAGLSGLAEPAFEERGFRSIAVPANWSLHGFEEPVYGRVNRGGEGFYRHRFRLAASLEGRRAVLHFGGVWPSAEVWLNGERLGRHDSGFTSFAFDVTPQLVTGENLLAVRVRQQVRNALFDTNDDWSLPGIYRDVWLELMPRSAYLDRLEVTTDLDHEFRDADLRVRAFVVRSEPEGRSEPSPDLEVAAVLTGPDGREVRGVEAAVAGLGSRNGRDVLLRMQVERPALWSAESPSLYDLRVDLMRDGTPVHSRSERVGFREVSTAGGVLRVNGQPVTLRGVCRHDEHPDVGRATRREHWEQDIRLMKAANINTVRTAHYPPGAGFIRLCDELGLYVIDEVPTGYGGERLNDPSFAGAVLQRARETVARDRNRPSVIIWSIGNEDPVTDLHLDMVRAVKGMDPTRPTLLPWHGDPLLPPEVDILAPHYPSAEGLERLAAEARRPVVTTEYTHALGEADFGGLESRWRALTRHPAGAGGTVWLWADQGVKRPVAGRRVVEPRELGYGMDLTDLLARDEIAPGFVHDARGVYGEDGVVNADRSPERDYWEVKAVYAPVEVLDSELPWRGGQPTLRVRLANGHDFTDLAAVGVEWSLMAGEDELDRGEARLKAPPHTVATLEVPTSALDPVEPDLAYYVVLRFSRPDGSSLAERAVRLRIERPPRPSAAETQPTVLKRGTRVEVTVGRARWAFDSATGSLTSLVVDGRELLMASRLAIWRPMTISERRNFEVWQGHRRWPPSLEEHATTLQGWSLSEVEGQVAIEAEVEHEVDERNSVIASYRYVVAPDASLEIAYALDLAVETPWLPEVGMALETAPGLERFRWQGLGPLDATPNKRAAARFGVFSCAVESHTALGTKAEVEWAEVTDGAGRGFRVTGTPFVRYEPGASGGKLRALSAVQGSFTKFRGPEDPGSWLRVTADTRFTGQLRIAPLQAPTQ